MSGREYDDPRDIPGHPAFETTPGAVASRDDLVLPEGGEWATAPLLDRANLGRYVVTMPYSGGRATQVAEIVKVGRINVHVQIGWGSPTALLVDRDRATAADGYTVTTHEEYEEAEARRRFNALIHRTFDMFGETRLSTATLGAIAALIEQDASR